MSVLELDENGGLVRGRSFRRIEGADEIAQGIAVRLRLIRGEVLADKTAGPRYVGLVLERNAPTDRVEAEIARECLAVPGVVSVDSIETTLAGTDLTIAVEVTAQVADQRQRLTINATINVPVGTVE